MKYSPILKPCMCSVYIHCFHRCLGQFVFLCLCMHVNAQIFSFEFYLGDFTAFFQKIPPHRAQRDDELLSTFFCRCISKHFPVFVALTSVHSVLKWLRGTTLIWIKIWWRLGTMESFLSEKHIFCIRMNRLISEARSEQEKFNKTFHHIHERPNCCTLSVFPLDVVS